jgi:response regulator RpfG family c-di-GMP phosphodiesterase
MIMAEPRSRKLLIIEDNPGDSRLIRETLKEGAAGEFELHEAIDLATGLSIAEGEKIEALLLDLALPDSTGLDTFQKVHEKMPNIPVIILSGTTDEELALEAVRDGAQDYFVKGSIDAQILVRALRYAIERSRRERDLEIIASVTYSLRATQEPDEIISISLQHAMTMLDAEAGAILLLDQAGENLVVRQAIGGWEQRAEELFSIEGAITGEVIATREPFFENDVQSNHDARLDIYKDLAPGLSALMIVPMEAEGAMIGVFILGSNTDIQKQDFNSFHTLSNIVANNIHRAVLYERAQDQLEQLNSLRAIDLAITTSMDLRMTLKVILDQIMQRLRVDAATILLVDMDSKSIRLGDGRGFKSAGLEGISLRFGESLAGRAAFEERMVRLDSAEEMHRNWKGDPFFLREGFVCYIGIPLIAKNKVQGVLEVFNHSPFPRDPAWHHFLEMLAGQTAAALDNSSLFRDLQRSNTELAVAYDNTIEGWARALDLRDKETEGHTRRVTEMAERTARALGLEKEEILHLRRGALLHDMGKLGVPDGILLKPGPLTDEEWEIMRQHPTFAYEMLSPIEFLKPALDIPYCHHEKWNGSGYPRGLKGERIPIVARIFAVADVWDALTNDRPYRKAWTEEKAREYIVEQAGKHFDPQIAKLFLKLLEDGAF